jgi:hypothetical protein
MARSMAILAARVFEQLHPFWKGINGRFSSSSDSGQNRSGSVALRPCTRSVRKNKAAKRPKAPQHQKSMTAWRGP